MGLVTYGPIIWTKVSLVGDQTPPPSHLLPKLFMLEMTLKTKRGRLPVSCTKLLPWKKLARPQASNSSPPPPNLHSPSHFVICDVNGSKLFTQKCIKSSLVKDGSVCSLRIQPPLIRSRYYVRNSYVVAGANERRLYSQATQCGA